MASKANTINIDLQPADRAALDELHELTGMRATTDLIRLAIRELLASARARAARPATPPSAGEG